MRFNKIPQIKREGAGGEGADAGAIPPPLETLPVYSEVFLKICIASLIGAVICFILSFFLTNWMHKDEPTA